MSVEGSIGTFDYVVVGAGSAGCVLANRLSANPANRVLLLEAGGKDNYIWVHIPVGYLYCFDNPRTDWRFKTEGIPGLGGRSLAYPRGRILGGSSAINGMLYLRGQARDYDGWAQMGNPGWDWESVLPFFKKSEDYAEGADDMHGAGGEWRVEKQRLRWEVLEAFRDACEAAGIPKTEDFNRGNNEGAGYFRVNQKAGWRWSAARGFLRPALKRANLKVITGARVQRFEIEDGRAQRIVWRDGSGTRSAEIGGELVLSAGAVGSPHLLQLSGVGPGGLLQDNGVAVRHALPGVGENLQDHLQIRCAYKVQGVPTLNDMTRTIFGKGKIGLEYLLRRTGPMSMAPSQLGVFVKSEESLETPDLEYHVQPLSLDGFGQPLHPFSAFTASVCHLRPESRGTIRLKSPDPDVPPAIQPHYLSTAGDKAVAARAIRLTRRIVAQAPLAAFQPEEFKPGSQAQSEEELIAAAGQIGSTIFHPVGTARMGTDADAVVDSRLRVHGIRGLRVVDASVMPTITSGNTNSPTIMIAEKGAEMILGDGK